MPENTTKYQDRLGKIRQAIERQGLSGFILPRTDEFQGEFLAEYAERLSWLSGFTGSAGAAVILQDQAVILSDGRYTIQMKNQVDSNLFDTDDITKISMGEWLSMYAKPESKIGYDVWLYTPKQLKVIKDEIEGKNITLIPVDVNPIDEVWFDQPKPPKSNVTIFPDEIAGNSSADKRCDVAKLIKANGCSSCLLTLSDSICWLLNVRGGDVDYSPLVLSYGMLYDDGSFDWFVDKEKLSEDVISQFGEDVRIYEMDFIEERISQLSGCVWMDRSSAPCWFDKSFRRAGLEILDLDDPCIAPKAIKTTSEKSAIRAAHVQDGVAIAKFLYWLSTLENYDGVSEISVEDKLESFRRECADYIGASFPTIAGFAGNGAIVHYRATKDSNAEISVDGLLLVDSGGQYRWGTTDITRTVAINDPTQEQRENYTRVLQGHIALATAIFPKGTVGKEIDSLARGPLQKAGLDYAHGTGHGVGCYLCVHESAAGISPRGEQPLEEGMLISNEPGYYKEGEYGIRIENLVLVEESEADNMLQFETVTYAPYARNLIDLSMLNDQELSYIRWYSSMIIDVLSPYLPNHIIDWLKSEADF
ncbi:MAG: aminopeptidase P family protein [Alphaproteobacteria bacterium]